MTWNEQKGPNPYTKGEKARQVVPKEFAGTEASNVSSIAPENVTTAKATDSFLGRFSPKQIATNVNKTKNSWIKDAHSQRESDNRQTKKEFTTLQRYLRSSPFIALSSTMIITNAALIGVETRVDETSETKQIWLWIEIGFTVWYSLELLLRFMSDGIQMIQDRWIQFDLTVLLIALLDLCVLMQTNHSAGEITTAANALRITRVLKLARIVRLIRVFKELSLLVESIGGALKTLVWTLWLMLIILYIFGIFFFEVLGKHAEDESIREIFDTLPEAMLSLFKIMTLDGWSDIAFAVWQDDQCYPMVFMILVFIVLCSFALLNVFMAVIVEHTLESGMDRQDEVMKKAQKNLEQTSSNFLEVFLSNDADRSGTLTKAEFIHAIHNPTTRSLLQKMGAGDDFGLMDDDDIGALFDIIDIDKSGELLPQEFVNGLLHMRGPARARSIFELHCEMQARSNRAEEIHDHLYQKMEAMSKQMEELLKDRSDRAEEIQQTLTNRLDRMSEEIHSIQAAVDKDKANLRPVKGLQRDVII